MQYTTTVLFALLASASAFAPSNPTKLQSPLRMAEDAAEKKPEAEVKAPEKKEKVEAPAPAMAMASGNTKEALVSLAGAANPVVKYYDPLSLADADFWGQGTEATIGFLRHAEIKHSRVAMAAFVGYCVQSNYHFPWAQTLAGAPHPAVELGPEAQWDATPANAKWQIITVIGLLELWDECGGGGAMPHYMRGRQPGKYPKFDNFRDQVHFVLDLYDPFGLFKNMKDEQKERRLVMEINNGRLAMLGIFGFLSADKIEGSVPLLKNIAKPYEGSIMAPFQSDFTFFS